MSETNHVVTIQDAESGPFAPGQKPPTAEELKQGETVARPDFLLPKFKTIEEQAKAYTELEKKLGTPAVDPATPAEKPADATIEPAKPATLSGMEKYDAEFRTSGKLSDASYTELEARGIPRPYVDAYIASAKSTAAAARDSLVSVFGGDEGFKKVSEWAQTKLTPAELTAYNTAVNSGDVGVARLAVENLKHKFDAAYGKPPTLVGGKQGQSLDVYESRAQIMSDMNDPRYDKDPAYRTKVQQKIGRSPI